MSCRVRPDARPHPHACSDAHRAQVEGYRAAREAWQAAAEAATGGYGTELEEWRSAHPAPTFGKWLKGTGR